MVQEEKKLESLAMAEQCECCRLPSDEGEPSYDCASRRTVFTAREEEVLARIRQVSEQARELKKQLEQISAEPDGRSNERLTALSSLEKLRQVRAQLEKERIAAAEERMRMLGHA